MAKIKETKATYSTETVTVVTSRGTTEIPRALRQRYGVTAKSRLRWMDTGHGLLVVPEPLSITRKARQRASSKPTSKPTYKSTKQSKREFLRWLDEWMQEPDDWTPAQWDEFEQELRANRVTFRDIEI
ncbi:MAG: hypothetical protein N2559_00290 [Anaerolineae bacterium]|nr:hypothetical protein [Anaerolineae bacterium]